MKKKTYFSFLLFTGCRIICHNRWSSCWLCSTRSSWIFATFSWGNGWCRWRRISRLDQWKWRMGMLIINYFFWEKFNILKFNSISVGWPCLACQFSEHTIFICWTRSFDFWMCIRCFCIIFHIKIPELPHNLVFDMDTLIQILFWINKSQKTKILSTNTKSDESLGNDIEKERMYNKFYLFTRPRLSVNHKSDKDFDESLKKDFFFFNSLITMDFGQNKWPKQI